MYGSGKEYILFSFISGELLSAEGQISWKNIHMVKCAEQFWAWVIYVSNMVKFVSICVLVQ